MPHDLISELPELIEWLQETIEPIQGQKWRIELNSGGSIVQVKASVVTSETQSPNQSMTISRVTEVRFRLANVPSKRTTFATD